MNELTQYEPAIAVATWIFWTVVSIIVAYRISKNLNPKNENLKQRTNR